MPEAAADLRQARDQLGSMLQKCRASLPGITTASRQTLLTRRIAALELALRLIEAELAATAD